MTRKYAIDLEAGDIIGLHPNLMVQRAVVTGFTEFPSKDGRIVILDLESNSGLWKGAKAKIAFLGNQKVECTPIKKPLWTKIKSFFEFFNFTR